MSVFSERDRLCSRIELNLLHSDGIVRKEGQIHRKKACSMGVLVRHARSIWFVSSNNPHVCCFEAHLMLNQECVPRDCILVTEITKVHGIRRKKEEQKRKCKEVGSAWKDKASCDTQEGRVSLTHEADPMEK